MGAALEGFRDGATVFIALPSQAPAVVRDRQNQLLGSSLEVSLDAGGSRVTANINQTFLEEQAQIITGNRFETCQILFSFHADLVFHVRHDAVGKALHVIVQAARVPFGLVHFDPLAQGAAGTGDDFLVALKHVV